jgi:CheY-like chemotaxis protein
MAADVILIVDDNPANLKLVATLLAARGYDVTTALDAVQTVPEIERRRPTAILMDLQLPGMDGLELTRRLKADPATCAIPVMAVTAYAMVGDEARARAAGCDDYVSKPIDTRALPGRVKALIERARASGDG